MRWRGGLVVLGVMVLVAGVSTAWATSGAGHARSHRVRIVLPHHALRAGQDVEITIVGLSPRRLMVSDCSLLQRRVSGRWVAITTTNGVRIPCYLRNGSPADT